MPSSEDYTVIWAGIYHRLKDNEIGGADEGSHPLIRLSREARLEDWYDTFEIDPVEGDIYCILIGRHIATLGYKEGQTRLSLQKNEIREILDELEEQFSRNDIKEKPSLHVLVHIEDYDDDE